MGSGNGYVEVEREMVDAAVSLLADAGRGCTDHSAQAYEDAARALICDVEGLEWNSAGWKTEAQDGK